MGAARREPRGGKTACVAQPSAGSNVPGDSQGAGGKYDSQRNENAIGLLTTKTMWRSAAKTFRHILLRLMQRNKKRGA